MTMSSARPGFAISIAFLNAAPEAREKSDG
jgi:hypothetical protein